MSRFVRGGGAVCSQKRNTRTLWFAIDSRQEDYLAVGRADAFVMVMLPVAMERGDRLVCEDMMSERLHYQLCDILIPALVSAGGKYQAISIEAPLTAEPWPSEGAVGTGFSGGVDSLYTVMRHGKDSEYPVTHLAVFNSSNFQIHGKRFREEFQKSCWAAEKFAAEFGFQTVFLDTNFYEALGEVNPDTYWWVSAYWHCNGFARAVFSVHVVIGIFFGLFCLGFRRLWFF